MPYETAILRDVISVHPDQSVAECLNLMISKRVRAVPVVEVDGRFVGMCTIRALLKKLIPISATFEDGLPTLDFVVGSAPGAAKKLSRIRTQPIRDHLEDECPVVHEDTPTWEVIRLLCRYGSPLPVVREADHALVGLVSDQSIVSELDGLISDMEHHGPIAGGSTAVS